MYLVAYDGSEYAKGGLIRAVECADLSRVEVEAFTVVPRSARFARGQGWVSSTDAYDFGRIVGELHEQVTTLAPEATFHYASLDGAVPPGRIASEIRSRAINQDANVVFVGSENAGRIVTPVSSVGSTVAAEQKYDVHIVRTRPRAMTDIDPDRRQQWLREDRRPKPNWGGDVLRHRS